MFLLMYCSSSLNTKLQIGDVSEKGITFWSMIYIPIVVAMAAKQNVIGALDGGLMAIVAGIFVVVIPFSDMSPICNFVFKELEQYINKNIAIPIPPTLASIPNKDPRNFPMIKPIRVQIPSSAIPYMTISIK